jgi:hypothetical protein
MHILRKTKKQKNNFPKRGQFDFARVPKKTDRLEPKKPTLSLESPHDALIEEFSADVILHWRAPEFEVLERDHKWYITISAILFLIVGYAILVNAIVMAITFILIGVVGYIYIHKEPRVLNFMIVEKGLVAGRDMYEFENLQSFWIFYEPDKTGLISLHTKSYLSPFVHIPIHDQDPARIREILVKYIPEEKKEPGVYEILSRLLKL